MSRGSIGWRQRQGLRIVLAIHFLSGALGGVGVTIAAVTNRDVVALVGVAMAFVGVFLGVFSSVVIENEA